MVDVTLPETGNNMLTISRCGEAVFNLLQTRLVTSNLDFGQCRFNGMVTDRGLRNIGSWIVGILTQLSQRDSSPSL